MLPRNSRPHAIGTTTVYTRHNVTAYMLLNGPTRVGHITTSRNMRLNTKVRVISPRIIHRDCINHLIRLHGGGNVARAITHRRLRSGIILNALVLRRSRISNLISNTIRAATGAVHPPLRLVGATPNDSLMSSIFFVLLPRRICICNSYTVGPSPATRRLTRVTVRSTSSTTTFNVRPHITVLSCSANASNTNDSMRGIHRTAHLTRRGHPSLVVSNPLRCSTTMVTSITGSGTPGSPITNHTAIFVFPSLGANGAACGTMRHSTSLVSVKPVLRNVHGPIGSLSHNTLISSVICAVTLATVRSTRRRWSHRRPRLYTTSV